MSEKQEKEEQKSKRLKPLRVDFREEERDDFAHRIEGELRAGRIPKILAESSHLIGKGESEHADTVIDYIKSILDRLSMASHDKPCPDLNIYLSDQDTATAGVITKIDPPILIFSLGLIDKITELGYGEDHIAAILGHERFHLLRHEKWEDLNNGRPEETIGDVYGVIEADKAGYNPQALGDFFRSLKSTENGKNNLYQRAAAFMDEHPDLGDRIRNTELAIANLQLKKSLDHGFIKVPDHIIAAADHVRYVPHFELYKQNHNFDEQSAPKRLDLLVRYFNEEIARLDAKKRTYGWIKNNKSSDPKQTLAERIKALKDEQIGKKEKTMFEYQKPVADGSLMALRLYQAYDDLIALRDEPGIKEEAYKKLRSVMTYQRGDERKYESTNAHYTWMVRQLAYLSSNKTEPVNNYTDYHGRYHMGKDRNSSFRHNKDNTEFDNVLPPILLRLRTDSKAFWNANTKEEAIAAAKRYLKADQYFRKYRSGIKALDIAGPELPTIRRIDIRSALEEEGHYRFPWENIVRFLKDPDIDKDDRLAIQMAAVYLGCPDQRVFYPDSDEDWSIYGHGNRIELHYSELGFDDQGNIISMALSAEELLEQEKLRFQKDSAAALYESEYNIQKERDLLEKELITRTDWSMMEEDFWGFITANHQHLAPVHSVVPGEFPFAGEFMDRLHSLLEKNPERWRDTYIEFITGYNPEEELERRKSPHRRYDEKDHTTPYSLPDLLSKSGEKYFGYSPYYGDFHREFKGKRGKLSSTHPMSKKLASHHDKRYPKTYWRKHPKTGRDIECNRKPPKVDPSQEDVKIPLKIDHGHPYLKALIDFDLFEMPASKRLNIISNFRYYNPEAASINAYFKISPRRIFNLSAFNSARSFSKYTRSLKSHETNKRPSYHWSEYRDIELLRALRRLHKQKPIKRFSISRHSIITIMTNYSFLDNKELAKNYQKELKKLIEEQIRQNKRIDFKKSVPLKTLIKRYIEDHGGDLDRDEYGILATHGIFATRPHLERAYQEHIKKRIMALPSAERAQHIAKLLALPIKDPDYRNWAIDEWVASTVSELGKDSGDKLYGRKILPRIKKAVRDFDSAQGMNCVVRLLDKAETQEKVSVKATKILSDTYGRKFLEKDIEMRLIESAIKTCAEDAQLRQAFLDYIASPITDERTDAFSKLLKKRAGGEYSDSDFVKSFFDPRNHVRLAPIQERTIVNYLHQNFWALPFELRTVYLDRILFPVEGESEEIFDHAVNFVLDKVLPVERKFAPEAREALLTYLDHCPSELRRTTFSAILATTEQAAQKGELRPGQVLSYVLARTGAAGGQFLQASHSYLSGIQIDDPDLALFRDDLKTSKVDFDRPMRAEIFERMKEALPKEMLDEIKNERIGKILGCGSTAYVIERERNDGNNTAIKLMRKDVMPIADLQFERFLAAFKDLAAKHDHYKPLPLMVENAKKLIKISANGLIGKDQIDYATKEYDGLKIKINGQLYSFNVAKSISAGPEYIEAQCIKGKHLNDLEMGAQRTCSSIAIEAAEVYRSLRGRATDKDIHGGQQGIDRQVIGMFDQGQLPYDLEKEQVCEPNDAQKRALGRLLGIIFNAAMEGRSVTESLVDAVTSKNWGQEKAYIVDEQRALLARADVRTGIGSNEKERSEAHKAVFRAVWSKGQIDPQIFKGLTDTISLKTCKELFIYALSDDKSPLKIEIEDQNVNDDTPVLGYAQMVKAITGSALRRAFNFVTGGNDLEREPVDDQPHQNSNIEKRSQHHSL